MTFLSAFKMVLRIQHDYNMVGTGIEDGWARPVTAVLENNIIIFNGKLFLQTPKSSARFVLWGGI